MTFKFDPKPAEIRPSYLDVAKATAEDRQKKMQRWSELDWGKRHKDSLDF